MAYQNEAYNRQASDDGGFDLQGVLDSATKHSDTGRRRSMAGLSLRRHTRNARFRAGQSTPNFLPSPTVTQRKRGAFNKRGEIPFFDATEPQNLNEVNAWLEEQNADYINSGGTIRLPSDLLYRRKSREPSRKIKKNPAATDEVDEFESSIPSDWTGGRRSTTGTAKKINEFARQIAALRNEEAPLAKGCAAACNKFSDAYQDFTFLNGTLSRIQGKFGSAIMEYFAFVKWLFLVNVVISLMMLPIIIPQLLLKPKLFNETVPTTKSLYETQALNCSERYQNTLLIEIEEKVWYMYLVDFIQGTGFFEKSALFYGHYFDKVYFNELDRKTFTYDMSVAFLLVLGMALILSLALLLRGLSSYLTSAVIVNQGSVNRFSTTVLADWDYGLSDARAVKLKMGLLRQELKQLKAAKEYEDLLLNRTTKAKAQLYTIRMLVNLVVMAILGSSGYAIWMVQEFSTEALQKKDNEVYMELLYEYLPTIVITGMYLVIPLIFYALVSLETYSAQTQLIITLLRILFIRLASLGLLLFVTIYDLAFDSSCVRECGNCGFMAPNNTSSTTSVQSKNMCWETYMGQQIYKLVILDFAVMLLITFLLEFPRQAIYKRLHKHSKLLSWIGQQEFDMPKNVMDVLYTQTLCWIGLFFSPFIPLMVTVKIFIFFWVKKVSLFRNQKPSTTLSKSSDVYSLYLWVMLLSLILSYIVLALCLQQIPPSQSCGPFRVYHDEDSVKFLTAIKVPLYSLHDSLKLIIEYLTGTPAVVVIIFALGLSIYSYMALSSGLSQKIKLLADSLRLSVRDKQFILGQVNKIAKKNIRQQQREIRQENREGNPSADDYNSTHSSTTNTVETLGTVEDQDVHISDAEASTQESPPQRKALPSTHYYDTPDMRDQQQSVEVGRGGLPRHQLPLNSSHNIQGHAQNPTTSKLPRQQLQNDTVSTGSLQQQQQARFSRLGQQPAFDSGAYTGNINAGDDELETDFYIPGQRNYAYTHDEL